MRVSRGNPYDNSVLDSLSDAEQRLLHGDTVNLIDKIYRRRRDIWSDESPMAFLNSQNEDISKDVQRVFTAGIKMKNFIKALGNIYPTLPEEKMVKIYRIFKFILGRRKTPLPLP